MYDYLKEASDLAVRMTAYSTKLLNTESGNLLSSGAEKIMVLIEQINALREENKAFQTAAEQGIRRHYDYEGRLKEFMKSGQTIDTVPTESSGHGSHPDAHVFRATVARLKLPIEASSKTLSNGQRIVLLIRTDL